MFLTIENELIMEVNYIQVAYVLGVTNIEAKYMLYPFIERFKGEDIYTNPPKNINIGDLVESSLLNKKFRHPSPMLDGKDTIEYTITSLRKDCPPQLKKQILDYLPILKKGKLTGRYAALRHILTERQLSEIDKMIKERHKIFIASN